MVSIPYLKKGSRIGIVSTARKISEQELQPALQFLRNCGFDPVTGQTIGSEYHQFAGDDNLRTRDLQAMLDDPTLDAILCARGGYGTMRIIDRLDFTGFMKHPKWICGYSDITVLLAHLSKNLGVPALHSTMPLNFPADGSVNEAMRTLADALTGNLTPYTFPAHALNREGSARGLLMGGNLSILYALQGSAQGLANTPMILFLEDLDEYLYHVDRMVLSLKRGGLFDRVKGLLVGGMSDMKDNAIPYGRTAEEIIAEHAAEFDFPVAFGFPAGHIERNLALYTGREAVLTAGPQQCSLQYV